MWGRNKFKPTLGELATKCKIQIDRICELEKQVAKIGDLEKEIALLKVQLNDVERKIPTIKVIPERNEISITQRI